MSNILFQKCQGCYDLAKRDSTRSGPSFPLVRHGPTGFLEHATDSSAGTVSGAPKVRAMQLIAELEREKRGVYAGAVGYFGYGNVEGEKEIEGAMDVSCISLLLMLGVADPIDMHRTAHNACQRWRRLSSSRGKFER
jgi:hypothetical protein